MSASKILLRNTAPLALVVGKSYLNAKRQTIKITAIVPAGDADYDRGFRFRDHAGIPYTETGHFSTTDQPHVYDLVLELPDDFIETIETETVVTVEPGFFGRLAQRVRRNPVKSTIGAGVVAGVGAYGGYNYYDHGSVLPGGMVSANDIREVGDAVAAFLNR